MFLEHSELVTLIVRDNETSIFITLICTHVRVNYNVMFYKCTVTESFVNSFLAKEETVNAKSCGAGYKLPLFSAMTPKTLLRTLQKKTIFSVANSNFFCKEYLILQTRSKDILFVIFDGG